MHFFQVCHCAPHDGWVRSIQCRLQAALLNNQLGYYPSSTMIDGKQVWVAVALTLTYLLIFTSKTQQLCTNPVCIYSWILRTFYSPWPPSLYWFKVCSNPYLHGIHLCNLPQPTSARKASPPGMSLPSMQHTASPSSLMPTQYQSQQYASSLQEAIHTLLQGQHIWFMVSNHAPQWLMETNCRFS